MESLFAASQLDTAVGQSKELLERFTNTFLSGRSVLTFVLAIVSAIVAGRIIAALMRRFTRAISRKADKTQDLKEVNRLRRIETLAILTIALIRMLLLILALYFWWVYAHPNEQPTALIGASALGVIIAGATIGPILRDLAYGGVMMAEHWYGVGDYVRVDPFADMEGVIERVTLRSTKLRGLNGESIWVSNQNIQGVRVLTKGVLTVAIELFVSDLKRGLQLIEQTNMRLPQGPLMVVRPLHIMSKVEVGPRLWHITAVGETAPGRKWLLEKYAKDILQEMDEESRRPVLQTDPIVRYADSDAERRFARTIQNARKSPLQRKRLPLPEAILKTIEKPIVGVKKAASKPRHRARKIQ
jgi:hypothetical protein